MAELEKCACCGKRVELLFALIFKDNGEKDFVCEKCLIEIEDREEKEDKSCQKQLKQ